MEPSPQNWAKSTERVCQHIYCTSMFWYKGGRKELQFPPTRPASKTTGPLCLYWKLSLHQLQTISAHRALAAGGPCIHALSPFFHLKETCFQVHSECAQLRAARLQGQMQSKSALFSKPNCQCRQALRAPVNRLKSNIL